MSIRRDLDKLVAVRTPAPVDSSAATQDQGTVYYGTIIDGNLLIDDSEDGSTLEGPFATLAPYADGDRVAFVLRGRRPMIISIEGGFQASDEFAGMTSVAEWNREILEAHEEHLAEVNETISEINEHNRDVVDPFIRDTDQALTVELPAAKQAAADAAAKALEALTVGNRAETKADDAQASADDALYIGNLASELAAGLIWVGEEEPAHELRVSGQIWIKTNAEGQMAGVYRLQDPEPETAVWDEYTTITGVLIVPGERGPQIISKDGAVLGDVAADSMTTEVLAANSVGAKQLIVGEINRTHLDADVDGVLEGAEEIASRVVIEPSSITISRSVVGDSAALTALRLEATRMDFIVANKSVAYIDSERDLMSIGNAYVRDSIQIGEHQVRRLGQGNITLFQWTGV